MRERVTNSAGRNCNLRNPTYTEVLKFTASDQTDKNSYDENNYTCVNFAYDFKENASNSGYICRLVYVKLREPTEAHLLVCFDTTDSGRIFIEPQTDDEMNLTVG